MLKRLSVLLWIAVACCLMGGCATSKKIAADIVGEDPLLNKKAAFFSPQNRSAYGGREMAEAFSVALKNEWLRNCDNLAFVDTSQIRRALEEMPRLASGEVDNLALAEVGRLHGLNILVEPVVLDVRLRSIKRGIWGFREETPVLWAAFLVKIYDTETSATLLNEVFEAEVVNPLEELALEGAPVGRYDARVAAALLAEALPAIGVRACEQLSQIPWKGFIVKNEGDRYVLSSGAEAGLAVGDVLEVLKMGDPIQGVGEQVFLIPGPKIGEVRVSEVGPQKSVAVALSGEGLDRSCSVRLKR